MILRANPLPRRGVILGAILLCTTIFLLFHSSSPGIKNLSNHVPIWRPSSSSSSSATNDDLLPLPAAYDFHPPVTPFCEARFSERYLEGIRDHGFSYCTEQSRSGLTCFHENNQGTIHSMCVGHGARLDPFSGKFALDCALREFDANETERGAVPFENLPAYWYETGPANVFNLAVDVAPSSGAAAVGVRDADAGRGKEDDEEAPKNFLLLKREGEGNPWHCMMEIFSTFMTFDVLQMARDPMRGNEPFFRDPDDVRDTQVVIIDDREDGPYFDLWTLFAHRKPMRLKAMLADPTIAPAIQDATLIVPLAGSSNPFWQDDENSRQCTDSALLTAFSDRVVEFYHVPEPPARQPRDRIVVTFINRTSHRRLVDQDELFAALRNRTMHMDVRFVDFAAITFAEQVRAVRETDVLVGVHGAGLTHAMFMRHGRGAMVEIQPGDMVQHGFRDVAVMRGLEYFRAHGEEVQEEQPTDRDWHWHDVRIEKERFVEVVDAAVKAMYSKGLWSYDVN